MSRQITKEIVKAFMNDVAKRINNSEVHTDFISTRLYLHNNCIAIKKKDTGRIEVSMAGWNTVTTRERLNGLPNVRVTQKDFIPYLNGKEIDPYEWYAI